MKDTISYINELIKNDNLGIRLNVEVRVAGGLIWDSIEKLANISYFPKYFFKEAGPNNTEDCYMCIYNASQGIERLQKVLIELSLSKNKRDTNEEKTMYDLLMSHDHVGLNKEIMKITFCSGSKYGKLVNDLMVFYNKIRYHNYKVDDDYNKTYFYDILCSYGDKINDKDDSVLVKELESFKNNFGRILGDYSLFLYKEIKKISKELNIFTYELNGSSKSSIVFLRDEKSNLFSLYKEYIISKKEVLFYLALNGNAMFEKFNEKELNIDPSFISDFCKAIIDNSNYDYYDEVNELYDQLCSENKTEFKNRIDFMNYIFSDYFEYDDDSQDYDD